MNPEEKNHVKSEINTSPQRRKGRKGGQEDKKLGN